jgi:hypothetical protein
MNLFETQLQEGRMVAGLPPFKRRKRIFARCFTALRRRMSR